MSIPRREFLKYIGAGAAATALPHLSSEKTSSEEDADVQRLHQDYESNNPGTEYYFLGNGLITAVLQTSASEDAGTHCGLLVMSPEHFGRKISTFLYHPERGLANSRLYVICGTKTYVPQFSSTTLNWDYPEKIPTLEMEWSAGECVVRENFFCPINFPAIVRTITIRNVSGRPVNVDSYMYLYPNLMFFDEYAVDRKKMTLTASGFQRLDLFSPQATSIGDRFFHIAPGHLSAGKEFSSVVILALNSSREEFESRGLGVLRKETSAYWKRRALLNTGNEKLDRLFNTAPPALRASVAHSGKADGGIWQYNLEWVRDQSMLAVANAMAGGYDVAESLLHRMLMHSVDDQGGTVDASRTRTPENVELDQNGALLYALWTHWTWSGNDSILSSHWEKISRVADYVLQPTFCDPSIGLVKNSREYWERDASFGVKEGYELAYQVWNILGLEKIADAAEHFGERDTAKRWRNASTLMKRSFLMHPEFALVDNGIFIKRRLVNGEVQRTFDPPNRGSLVPGMPLREEKISYCNPDTSSVLPIVYGLVDPKSGLSRATLRSMEQLWNQRWNIGGYGRYNVTSEPDSPGPWPFASLFVARAYLEAGDDEKVWRVMNWLLDVQGGKAGTWLEFYGHRSTPPLPPVGIVVWTWAEIVMFFIHHLLGVRPSPENISMHPRLLQGIPNISAKIPLHGHMLTLHIQRTTSESYARADKESFKLTNGALTVPLLARDRTIEFYLSQKELQ
ncbi:MAG: hypothetical protein KGJ59_00840 [Bacteroidota bacterium]|nr:hypothetical protein [Bacteroidota bacterium]